MNDVLCLRPEADFARLGVLPPASLTVTYLKPDDASLRNESRLRGRW